MKLITVNEDSQNFLNSSVKVFDYNTLDAREISLNMIKIMIDNYGLGLSANQVGVDGQIFVMKAILNKTYGDPLIVINPTIIELSQEKDIQVEGCLSNPNLFLRVSRPVSCVANFDTLTDDMNRVINVTATFTDIDARVFLHEYDHLNGVQFTDRVSKLKLKMAEKRRIKRN